MSTSTIIIPAAPVAKQRKSVLWTVYTFLALCAFNMGMLIWQLWGMTPNKWCFVAKAGSPTDPASCFNTLARLLDIKDHIVIGLLGTMAIIMISLAVVVLKVFVKVDAPGGISVNVGQGTNTDDGEEEEVPAPTAPTE
jgi:hypothetical protein